MTDRKLKAMQRRALSHARTVERRARRQGCSEGEVQRRVVQCFGSFNRGFAPIKIER